MSAELTIQTIRSRSFRLSIQNPQARLGFNSFP